jgi:hypothetical protein
MAELIVRYVETRPIGEGKPIKFKGHLIPEYFSAMFYVIDNDGIKVTKQNAKQFSTWTIEVILRVTKVETVEIIKLEALGSRDIKTIAIHFPPKPFSPKDYGTLQARHFNQLQENRTLLIGYAVQAVVQQNKFKKTKSGGYSWTLWVSVKIENTELAKLYKETVGDSYKKIDGTFLETFAERYKELVREGDKTPIKTIRELYYPDKSHRHVQSYATTCRKKGLLPKAEQGKNSPIRKTTKRKDK